MARTDPATTDPRLSGRTILGGLGWPLRLSAGPEAKAPESGWVGMTLAGCRGGEILVRRRGSNLDETFGNRGHSGETFGGDDEHGIRRRVASPR